VWQGTSQGLGATCPASPCWPPACHAQQCSSMPVLQHARAPACQCSSMPVLQHASAPASQCSSMPVLQQCSSMPVLQQCSSMPVLQHATRSRRECYREMSGQWGGNRCPSALLLVCSLSSLPGLAHASMFARPGACHPSAWPGTRKHVCLAWRMQSVDQCWPTRGKRVWA